MSDLRPELTRPIPARIERLPRHRGYPVPWFVAWLDGDSVVDRGRGVPDFRVVAPGAVAEAHLRSRCWVCGGALGARRAFVIGPMCAVNRTSAEPPGHRECGEWAARACPFLARPHASRREAGMPAGTGEVPGVALLRNPGAAGVWTTRRYALQGDGKGGVLFDMGEPTAVSWWAEGREATRDEVLASIESGEPLLRDLCDGRADHRALDAYVARAMNYLPPAA